jgi:hypothetical protein
MQLILKARHLKSGKTYTIVNDSVINATNKNNDELMVLYTDDTRFFVRECEEFFEKFEII